MARLFDTPGADSAYSRWQDPPSSPEDHYDKCECERCHAWHLNNDPAEFAENCSLCAEWIQERAHDAEDL